MNRTSQNEFIDIDDGFDYEDTTLMSGGNSEDAEVMYLPGQQTERVGQEGEPGEGRSGEISHKRPVGAKIALGLVLLALLLGVAAWAMNGRSTDDARKAYPVSGSGSGAEVSGLSGLDTGPRVGALAPDFELADVNTGKVVKLSSLRGKPVWLNYFATWCPPCKAELPDIKRVYAKYKDTGLSVIGIDMREDPAQVKAFTGSNGYDWTFVVDADGKVTDRYFVYGIPTHLFIDKEGVIRSVTVGGLTPEAMEQNISMIVGR